MKREFSFFWGMGVNWERGADALQLGQRHRLKDGYRYGNLSRQSKNGIRSRKKSRTSVDSGPGCPAGIIAVLNFA